MSMIIREEQTPIHEVTGQMLGWEQSYLRDTVGFAPRFSEQDTAEPVCYDGDAHLMTVAPTGAGKGRSVLIPNLLTWPGPAIVIDPKGENYHVTARCRREMGQRVVVLDPFKVAVAQSDRLNPMDIFDLQNSIVDCDAEMLASLLSAGHHFTRDPFWNDSANGIHSGLIAQIATTEPKHQRNLNRLRWYFYHDDMDMFIAKMLDDKKVTCQLARDEMVAYLSHPSKETRPSVRSTANTYIKALGSSAVAVTLDNSTFSLQDVVDGKPLTIYLIIPPEKLNSHKSLLRLWIATLLCAVTSRKVIPRSRTLFLLDEAAQLGELPALRDATTLLRGYGLQIWSFWQDLSQLRKLYEHDWETMINNSAVTQFFGVNNFRMAQDWAGYFGCDPHALLRMDPVECAVYSHGTGFHRCRKFDYLTDPAFAGLYDPNPRYALQNLKPQPEDEDERSK